MEKKFYVNKLELNGVIPKLLGKHLSDYKIKKWWSSFGIVKLDANTFSVDVEKFYNMVTSDRVSCQKINNINAKSKEEFCIKVIDLCRAALVILHI